MQQILVRKFDSVLKEPALSGSFVIRNLKMLLAGKDMVQELHRHDYFFILALQKGAGAHEIDFVSHTISDHCVFFLRPGQVHQIQLKATSSGYLLQFKPDFFHVHHKASAQLLRRVSARPSWRFKNSSSKKVFSILNAIFNEFKNKQEGYEHVIKANLGIFFIELLRQGQTDRSQDRSSSYPQVRLDEFIELLEKNFHTDKKASQYAHRMNLSVYQLNAITKSLLNKTCSQVIDEYIVLEAKRNLLATPNQVTQIAFELGYTDASYFIRYFKKHTGLSPEVFRSNFK